ncbi:hypothetical protein [Algiphilus aromaticivorans]|uniref:hypothetical protein n=1 Tax=Algiphilus aromaticivorans TaxID=382454 RepID=UPI0005C12B6D|nr:hypothetical protein [Algiphilus aromaticivorans]
MTTDTEVRPLTAHEATRSLPSLRGYTDIAGHVAAIADGRHAVYDTATHEAVERRELDAMRETIKAQDALLDERKAELERLRGGWTNYAGDVFHTVRMETLERYEKALTQIANSTSSDDPCRALVDTARLALKQEQEQ